MSKLPSNMAVHIILTFIWCVYSICVELLKIWTWLLLSLHLIDLYDTELYNRRPREFKLTFIHAYEFKQTHRIEKKYIIKIYSELFTLKVIQFMRHIARFGIIFTHLLIETFIINITKYELQFLKEDMIPYLKTLYSYW